MRRFHASLILAVSAALVAGGSVVAASPSPSPGVGAPSVPAGTLAHLKGPHDLRWFPTMTVLQDGRVLVVGGAGEFGTPVRSMEVLDPTTGTFSRAGTLPAGFWLNTTTLLPDGQVLIVGGYSGEVSRGAAYLWDPRAMKAHRAGVLIDSRAGHVATLLPDGRVLVAGGDHTRARGKPRQWALTAAEVWDRATERFSPAGTLGFTGEGWSTAGVLPDGRAVIIGTVDGSDAGVAETWDPATSSFSPAWQLEPGTWLRDFALLPDGRMLLMVGTGSCSTSMGDLDETCRDRVDLWEPVTGTLRPTGPLVDGAGWRGHSVTLLPDGSVVTFGGGRPCPHPSRAFPVSPCDPTPFTAERWDPATEAFTTVATAPLSVGGPDWEGAGLGSPVPLADGRILLLGMNHPIRGLVWDPSTNAFTPASTTELTDADGSVALPGGGAVFTMQDGETAGEQWYVWTPAP